MKVLLLAEGEDVSLSKSQWQERKGFWSGIGSFVIAFEGDVALTKKTTVEQLNQYDLVIANLDRSCLDDLLVLQVSRDSKVKGVSLIERCATDYLPANLELKKILDGSDLVNVINKHSLGFFRALTSAHCEYIGIPYPAEQIRKSFFVPKEQRVRRIMLPAYVDPPGITCNASYLAAKGHGLPMFGAQKERFNYGDNDYQPFVQRDPLPYMAFEGNSYAFMNLDHRYTWGRNVLDCAAMGVPCIATRSTGHAADFFPDLIVLDEFQVERASWLLECLIKDDAYYKKVMDYSWRPEIFAEYTHDKIREKIMSFL